MSKINYVKVLRENPMMPSAPAKTYAASQARAEMNINGLARHMAAHGSNFSRGTIVAVLTDAADCICHLIKDGYIVRLGDLGTFNVSLRSDGVCESIVDRITGKKPVFTVDNIKDVKVRFTAGQSFDKMMEEVEFEEVQTKASNALDLAEKHKQFVDGTYVPDSKREKNGGVQVVE